MTEEFDNLFKKYKQSAGKSKIKNGFEMGKYHMERENWELAIETFNIVRGEKEWNGADIQIKVSILKNLAVAMTKPNRESYIKYTHGQELLEETIRLDPVNSDLLATLGGTWKGINDELAYNYYKQALNIDEKDPYPLVNVVIYELKFLNDFKFEKKRKMQILEAITTRKKQVLENEELPWAYFDLGTFYLIRGVFKKAFNYYLLALKYCKSEWTIKTTLETLDIIKNIHYKKPYILLVRILLLLGMGFFLIRESKKNEQRIKEILRELKNLGFQDRFKYNDISDPPLIIASGEINQSNMVYVIDSLNHFLKKSKRSIVCLSNIFSHDLAEIFKKNSHINCFIYDLNDKFLKDKDINNSNIYLINFDSSVFPSAYRDILTKYQSWFNVFQYWFNILKSEIDPKNIRFIGFNSVKQSSIEYHLAIAFGAQVGFIDGSGKKILKSMNKNNLFRYIKAIDNNKKDIETFLK